MTDTVATEPLLDITALRNARAEDDDNAEAYLSFMTPGFPNFLTK
jgi:hypothetical protein